MTHHCHALNCQVPVPPEYLMCKSHWGLVPENIKRAVWANYREGQCDDKRPSAEWHEAADAAIGAVAVIDGFRANLLRAQKVALEQFAPQLLDEPLDEELALPEAWAPKKTIANETTPAQAHAQEQYDKHYAGNAKHSSEYADFGTPKYIVESARGTLGEIDLDPATTVEQNKVVNAAYIHTPRSNGLVFPWEGRVLLNPPGGICDDKGRRVIRASKALGRKACTETGECGLEPGHQHKGVTSSAVFWWQKLVDEWESGRTTAAIFVGFTIEILQTAQSCTRVPTEFPLCVPKERIPFLGPDGEPMKQPTHANVIVLLPGADGMVERFEQEFSGIGRVFNQWDGA